MPDNLEGKTDLGPSNPAETDLGGSVEKQGIDANQPASGVESVNINPESIKTDAQGDSIGKGSSGAADDSDEDNSSDKQDKKRKPKQPGYTEDALVLEIFESLPPKQKGLEPKIIARGLVRKALRRAKSSGSTDSQAMRKLNQALNNARYFYRKMVLEKK
jgi:hypothetical protein